MANHSLYATAVALGDNLRTAMQSRAVIEQAEGVLMASLHCTPEEAFQHLSLRSQRSNRKLRDVAADVVANL
ncbi:ANTAR domain-containing protein [Kineococcus sp. GCM10028916]|uniref:ANTAR domain-containing protein n=1 Tax=Kineococcus sp. GCM10028916 TaxID=3273394 RepID=UPI0036410FF4